MLVHYAYLTLVDLDSIGIVIWAIILNMLRDF